MLIHLILQRMSCKLKARSCYGGFLECRCGASLKFFRSPKEVNCCRFTPSMLTAWRNLYKPRCCWKMDLHEAMNFQGDPNEPPCHKPLCDIMDKKDISPQDLASYYKELINLSGIRSAAFIVATSKRSCRGSTWASCKCADLVVVLIFRASLFD